MMKVFVCVMAVLAMVQLMVEPSQAIDCADVDRSLVPCMPYLTGGAAQPAAGCCAGVKQLTAMATTTPDKRAACNCVKEAASHYQNIKDDAATGLPTKCGIPLSFPISKNIDCNS
ncbi:Plant lipid transfer protein/Par allergen [Macleaya cordata]|uniref:Non-specific lipid-transfer protein n=1 Tax=Macleaya cordata TaxID=56857 RepID=A0A200QFH7_MACCD|nr:Plant lipid transfer protein/Par allergen [Macleaya cordata]